MLPILNSCTYLIVPNLNTEQELLIIIHPFQWENITWNIAVIAFSDSDDYAPLTTVRPFEYMFYRNQSKYYALSSTFDLSFSNCYLVEMELAYGENYSPLAGFSVHVRQIVVLDQNLVPVWIGIQPSGLSVA